MKQAIDILERAADLVRKEQSVLRAQRRQFDAFRDDVRLAGPSSQSGGNDPTTGSDLLAVYLETVTSVSDPEMVDDELLEAELSEEFSPGLADVLLGDEAITQRRKRKLLVRTSNAIARREWLVTQLDAELETNQETVERLSQIRSETEALPICSIGRMPLDELLDVRQAYESLERRCEGLLTRRQRELAESRITNCDQASAHPLNEYLYADLETEYPVLSALTRSCNTIRERKSEPGTRERTGMTISR